MSTATVKSLSTRLKEIRSSFNFSPELENNYQETTFPHSIFMMRLAISLGALTYLSFFSLDSLMFPKLYIQIWTIRVFVLMCFMITLSLTYRPFFSKIHQPALFILLIIITSGQHYAMIISNSEIGSMYFFTGFLIILVCAYALSQLNLRNCLLLFAYMLFGYLWIGSQVMGWTVDGWGSELGLMLINNSFFLFAMNFVCAITYITIHYFRRQGFLAHLSAEEERKKSAIERLRIKISSDLHDDVGSILSGLSMQADILKLDGSVKNQERLNRLSELSRSAMSRMRDAVWAMDARKDKWESLQDRMREFAAETLGEKGIKYSVRFEDLNLDDNLPAEIRQNLYLIFKEAMTNVVKHSNATEVTAILKNDGTDFKMDIKDNGELQQKEFAKSGLGLANMKMRAEQIQGILQFIKDDGFGIHLQRDKI